ncbi:hypothetical protein HAX54_009454, partial [Datura stramonium]|nr:hypothetical protein [Datura stramonium]
KIIQDIDGVMLLKASLAIKALMVALNTMAHEVPSQYLDSFGKQQGEYEKLLLSTRNEDFVKDSVDEEQNILPPPLNRKLSPEAPVFVPKSVILKYKEPKAVASVFSPTNAYAIDFVIPQKFKDQTRESKR